MNILPSYQFPKSATLQHAAGRCVLLKHIIKLKIDLVCIICCPEQFQKRFQLSNLIH